MVAWFFRPYRVVYGHRNFIITVITKGQDVKVTGRKNCGGVVDMMQFLEKRKKTQPKN